MNGRANLMIIRSVVVDDLPPLPCLRRVLSSRPLLFLPGVAASSIGGGNHYGRGRGRGRGAGGPHHQHASNNGGNYGSR